MDNKAVSSIVNTLTRLTQLIFNVNLTPKMLTVRMGEASTSAGVSVLLRSNVITETENETAMQQINYLESKEVLGAHTKIATLHITKARPYV